MHVGITGSRLPLPDAQQIALMSALSDIAHRELDVCGAGIIVHHGCCTGADESAHVYARVLPGTFIHGYPGQDASGRSPYRMENARDCDILHPAKLYRDRNRDIIATCEVLIACPAFPEDHPQSSRSGTWQTIRLARNAGKPVMVIDAAGAVAMEPARGIRR